MSGKESPLRLLTLLRFTSQILAPRFPHALFPFLSAVYLMYARRRRSKVSVDLQDLPRELFEQLVPGHPDCLLVGCNLLEHLRVSGQVWVQVAGRLVQVIPVTGLPEGLALTTPTLMSNLGPGPLLLSLAGVEPQLASQVTLSLCPLVEDVSPILLDAALESYLCTPRYMCSGDWMEVDLTPANYYSTSPHCSLSRVFYRVVEVIGPSYTDNVTRGHCVVWGLTHILQDPADPHYLPPFNTRTRPRPFSLTATNYKQFLLSECPAGLESHLQELVECMRVGCAPGVRPLVLVRGQKGSGVKEVVRCSANILGVTLLSVDCRDMLGQAESKWRAVFVRANRLRPCLLQLRNIEDSREETRAFAAFTQQLDNIPDGSTCPVQVVATTSADTMSPGDITSTQADEVGPRLFQVGALSRLFLHTITITSPDAVTRTSMLSWLLAISGAEASEELVPQMVTCSAGFLYADLVSLVSHAVRNRLKHMKNVGQSSGVPSYLIELQSEDVQFARDLMQAKYSDVMGGPKIPSVIWDDVGGLGALRAEITRTVMLPLLHPKLLASGLRRAGLLFYGPPGTGKTLLAKAVATECGLNFLSIKGPELLNMYVGQSEHNIREVFERGRAASPCVIFFDELDSLAPNRGRSGDSGGVMDRVVSQLLAEMDGLHRSSLLFVIGATNRPDLVDPALLRPGRLDKLLFVGACEDKSSQLSVLTALTRRFQLSEPNILQDICNFLPLKLTGADLYSLCYKAWLQAARTAILAAVLAGEACHGCTHWLVLSRLYSLVILVSTVLAAVLAGEACHDCTHWLVLSRLYSLVSLVTTVLTVLSRLYSLVSLVMTVLTGESCLDCTHWLVLSRLYSLVSIVTAVLAVEACHDCTRWLVLS
uniref:Peroxisomal ATPase PEX6 n=2 Tax=Timema TaxID=61471 RepID=A0A7R9ECN5_9NEOP|nr:unnamed protein product [Timema monikensis]